MEHLPLFERQSRRALLRLGLGATGVLAAGSVLAACGSSDKDTFASDTTTGGTATTADGAASTTAAAAATTAAGSDTTAAAGSDTTTAAGAAGTTTLSFSYTASGGGRVRNPYIAVWLEDDAKNLVGLVSVWYSQREAKYLRELTEFAAVTSTVTTEQADAVSGATRQAGTYELEWDGSGLDGAPLSGAYTLFVEAAREHGPHSLVTGSITVGQAGTATLTGDGELSDVTVTVA